MLFYHGTTLRSAKNILNHGFKDVGTVWNCSTPNCVYIVAADNTNRNSDDAIRFAIEAAQLASAIKNVNDTDIAVFEFDVPDEIIENDILPDISCPNMNGCYTITTNILNNYIATNNIKMRIKRIKNAYIPYLRPFYLMDINTEYIPDCDMVFLEAVKTIKSSNHFDWFYDIAFNIDTNLDNHQELI